MDSSLVLVHTVASLIGVFSKLCAQFLPQIQVFHTLDEPLLENIRLNREVQEQDIIRLQSHIKQAERIGAKAVLVTCSTLSPIVDQIEAGIKVFKIDEAMMEKALDVGRRIGVIVTNQTTLEPTRTRLVKYASHLNKPIEIKTVLVSNAFIALQRGDYELHDILVKEAIDEISHGVDVVVLAQASTARVLDFQQEHNPLVPILTSPHTALERVLAYFLRE